MKSIIAAGTLALLSIESLTPRPTPLLMLRATKKGDPLGRPCVTPDYVGVMPCRSFHVELLHAHVR